MKRTGSNRPKLFFVSDLRNAFNMGKYDCTKSQFNEWVKELKKKRGGV